MIFAMDMSDILVNPSNEENIIVNILTRERKQHEAKKQES